MRETDSLRRFPERRNFPPTEQRQLEAETKLREIETRKALWQLRFYCWSKGLALAVAFAVAIDTVVSIAVGSEPEFARLLIELAKAFEG